jgi:protein-S-isoprenylcysteine O-methyltransferase Ste14
VSAGSSRSVVSAACNHGDGTTSKQRRMLNGSVSFAIRVWAIVTLGQAFRTTVEVDPGQAVISTGPYARIRHPSYAGLLLILAGLGFAVGEWRSLAICVLLPLPALLLRIRVEEAELTRVLGTAYRRYQQHTKRLIPGLW